MASVVQICNMALSHIGSEARVSSISPPDGSVEAGHCATFYDMARTEMLEPGNWFFALKRGPLAQVANLSTTWAYAYTKPSDCLRPLRILRPSVGITVFTQDLVRRDLVVPSDDTDSSAYEIEGDVIFTNEPDAVMVYTRDITDSTKFTPSFTSALSYMLASYLAGPIIKGNEGVRVGDAMRKLAMAAGDMSATSSANASKVADTINASIIAVRR